MRSAPEGHEQHFSVLPDGRCKCLLNGHVFPAEPQAVATFIRFTVADALMIIRCSDKHLIHTPLCH